MHTKELMIGKKLMLLTYRGNYEDIITTKIQATVNKGV